jgi:DNA-binding response OmpR family regulator
MACRVGQDHKPYNPVSLRVYIYRLRAKLEPFDLRIETMIGVGYRLKPAIIQSNHCPH